MTDSIYNDRAERFPSDRRDFVHWKKKMSLFLQVRKLHVYLTTPVDKIASLTSSSSKDVVDHDYNAIRAYNIIYQTLSKNEMVLCTKIKEGDVKSLWEKLNTVFGDMKSHDMLASIQSQFDDLSKLGSESMAAYIGRVEMLSGQYALANDDNAMTDKLYKYYILKGLSKSREWVLC